MSTFAMPKKVATTERPRIADLINALVVITCSGETRDMEVQGDNGLETRTASIVGIQPIDGRYSGNYYDDVYLFQRGLRGAVDGYPAGTMVCGRITKPSNAYELSQPTDADIRAAEAALTAAAPPF